MISKFPGSLRNFCQPVLLSVACTECQEKTLHNRDLPVRDKGILQVPRVMQGAIFKMRVTGELSGYTNTKQPLLLQVMCLALCHSSPSWWNCLFFETYHCTEDRG